MTVGEYARMINGEHWLKEGIQCDLSVVPCKNYQHSDRYRLPVKPSPNLPNMAAVYLYPTLGLFEGTAISVGRGTETPFQVIGHPDLQEGDHYFTPKPVPGASEDPKLKGKKCRGYDLQKFGRRFMPTIKKIHLFWLKGTYEYFPRKTEFFNDFFDLLAGTDTLRKQIENGVSVKKIRASWQEDLEKFKKRRKPYLIYE